MGGAMDSSIHPVEPLDELPVHIVERAECSSHEEIAFHVPDGILDLSLGLWTVGFAESGNEPVIREKVLKFRIPGVLSGSNCSFDQNLLDVVIEYLIGISTEVLKGVKVALDESRDIGGERVFHKPHSGIPENHTETVDLPHVAIFLDVFTLCPVNLSLDAGLRLIPENGWDYLGRTDLADVVFDNCISSGESLSLDLMVDT